jgi:gluconate 2-dehydrogenase gamma chain
MTSTLNRRELLERAAYLLGGALSAPAIVGVLSGCSAKPSAGWKPAFLTEEQGALVAEVVEIMIPRTDTPGAIDVGVPAFIDTMLKDTYPKEDQDRYIAGLKALDEQARREHGQAFVELKAPQRAALIQTVHDAAAAEERDAPAPAAQLRRPFILMTKELALLGFFTSEPGATQVLQYIPIPGSWSGCVPLSRTADGKNLATEHSGRF